MKVLVQWSKRTPGDWTEIRSANYHRLAKKPVPTGRTLDDRAGWVNALNVQGVHFVGYDNYAVEEVGGGCRVSVWNDDPDDLGPEGPNGMVWYFLPLAPDARLGGAWNTRQAHTKYGPDPDDDRPWSDFPMPAAAVTRHGIWMSDDAWEAHGRARSLHGWREWTEGLPTQEIRNGQLRPQRPLGRYDHPRGTRTYYQRDTARSNLAHTADQENEFSGTAGTGQTELATIAKATTEFGFVFTTLAGEPNSADWPNGTYRFQADVSASGADLTWRLGTPTSGTLTGHFSRLDSSTSPDAETAVQAEGDQSGSGLKLVTTSWNPAAGSAAQLFECLMAVRNAHAHSGEDLTLTFDADAFADGPWPATFPLTVSGAITPAGALSGKHIAKLALTGALSYAGGLAKKVKVAMGLQTPNYARPDSDVSVDSWTTAPLWQKLDDTSESLPPGDYITATGSGVKLCEVGLSNVADPGSGTKTRHALYWMWRLHQGAATNPSLTTILVQGLTTIASIGVSSPYEQWIISRYLLTEAEAANITDYTDLRLRFSFSGTNVGDTGDVAIAWLEVPIPNKLTFARTILIRKTAVALALTGAISFAGTLVRKTAKGLAGAVSPAGILTRTTKKGVSAVLSFAGTLATRLVKVLSISGAVSFAGDLVRRTRKTLDGSVSPTGTLTKTTKKPLTGAVSPAGALIKTTKKPLDGAASFTGALVRKVQLPLSGSVSPVGGLTKTIKKLLDSSLSPAGILVTRIIKTLSLTGALSFAGTLSRKTAKGLAGVLTSAGLLVRKTAKAFAGALATAGLLSTQYIPAGGIAGPPEFMAAINPSIVQAARIAAIANQRYDAALERARAHDGWVFDGWAEIPTQWTTYGRPFKYEAAAWEAEGEFYLEAYFRSTVAAVNVYARVVDQNDNPVADGIVFTNSASNLRVRGPRIPVLVDGNEYRVQFGKRVGGAGAFISGHLIYVRPSR